MRVHILGICGTFMAGVALLAKAKGYEVTGSDQNVYPPMSDLLRAQGIQLSEGYDPSHIPADVDLIVVGNVMSRGNPAVEHMLNQGIPFISGPAWLGQTLLKDKWVMAVTGTHGKTTTSSLLAFVLEYAGLKPGFLIGGVPENFGISARLGEGKYFVIEADEYDSAFFDKRAKFMHMFPKTAILNNIEFDHADIYDNLGEIERQFHHFVRTIPSTGRIVYFAEDKTIQRVLERGCYSETSTFGAQGEFHGKLCSADGSEFEVYHHELCVGVAKWSLLGMHNVNNALAVIAAANHVGVAPEVAIQALSSFKNVKRRLEFKSEINHIKIYDDFAHHPTAIATTLAGFRQHLGDKRIIVALDFRSNTMKKGVMKDQIPDSLKDADVVLMYHSPDLQWNPSDLLPQFKNKAQSIQSIESLAKAVVAEAKPGDHIVMLSNGSFNNFYNILLSEFKI